MTIRALNYAKVLEEFQIDEDCVMETKNLLKENKELMQVLVSPAVKAKEKHAVIRAVFDPLIQHFLSVLCDNGSMELIFEIFDAYEEIEFERKNKIRATLRYAMKPSEDQIEKIKEMICSNYKKDSVLLDIKEEETLLGGFVLTVGDKEYDKSIKGTLSSMYKTLAWR